MTTRRPHPPASLRVFLLIGQSNMAGRGRPGDVPALHDPDILMFRDGRWMPAVEPLHTDKPDIAGIGLGMSFAGELLAHDRGAPVGLVPCAVGGTPLRRWMPGADLYEHAVRTARAALAAAGSLAGVLWHQGEADAGQPETAQTYGDRLGAMIERLRSDLDAGVVPFIAGELGAFLRERPAPTHADEVNRQLHDLSTRRPAMACASAEHLTDNGDHLHFNAASLREFGRRYAEQYRRLRPPAGDA